MTQTTDTERDQIIADAERLDARSFAADANAARPGKYKGADDLALVVALDIITGHGAADETAGETDALGFAARVGRFVAVTDSAGFVTAYTYDTESAAEQATQGYDITPDGDGEPDERRHTVANGSARCAHVGIVRQQTSRQLRQRIRRRTGDSGRDGRVVVLSECVANQRPRERTPNQRPFLQRTPRRTHRRINNTHTTTLGDTSWTTHNHSQST